jgi:cytochrome c
MFKQLIFALFIISTLFRTEANAGNTKKEAEIIAFVKKAGAYYREHGRAKALAEFSNQKGKFIQNELYLFVYDATGTCLAHGQNPKMINKNMIDMLDADGVPIIRNVIKVGNSDKGYGWTHYRWPHLLTKNVEKKMSYTERFDDIFISSGSTAQ